MTTTAAPSGDRINEINGGLKDKSSLSSLVKKLKNRGLGEGREKRDKRAGDKEIIHVRSSDSRDKGGENDFEIRSSIQSENVSGAGKGRRGKKKRRKG